jgi:hypothetical protein
MISSLLLISCKTAPGPVNSPVPLVLEWPQFPNPAGKAFLEGDFVVMPLEYWLDIADYKVEMDRVRQILEAVQGAVEITVSAP